MKLISRDFSKKEKVLLVVFCLVLLGIGYYQFVDQPIRSTLETAKEEAEDLRGEITVLETKLALMRRMRNEMEDITKGGTVSEMASYNNSKAELAVLNDILSRAMDYSISFSNVTRTGDQIRRAFTLNFTAKDYDTVEKLLSELANNHYRCLIGDISCSGSNYSRNKSSELSVNATAVFYETMVGGVADAGLPVA